MEDSVQILFFQIRSKILKKRIILLNFCKMNPSIFRILAVLLLSAAAALSSSAQVITGGEFQWGVAARYDIFYYMNEQTSLNFSMGDRFNRKNYLGGQTGMSRGESYIDSEGRTYQYIGIPVLIDYIHYYPIGKAKNDSFYLGGEMGAVLQYFTDEEEVASSDIIDSSYDASPYLCLKFGLDFRLKDKLHLSFGLQANDIGAGAMIGVTF